ncbi:4-oxalocrotonate tautomerase [Pandoraea sp. PE-S2T-3]|nr:MULTISPECIES: 4-oxalocrotonate tautomerase [unclassified Pandoraea]
MRREIAMPTFHVELFEGRTVDQKRAFVKAVTAAAVETLGCTPESVDIIITDTKRENWATGGTLWSDPRPE